MNIQVTIDFIDRATAPLNKLSNIVGGFNKRLESMKASMNSLNQTTKLLDRMAGSAEKLSQPFIEYEKTLADFSALTGVAGDELKELSGYARGVGISSGLGATGAISAFKLLAGQIDVSKIGVEGLKNIHKEAIVLAQASGMTMEESANSLAGTINQFGLAAGDASRIINVLSAGSKVGAAEIPELAQSFKVVGAAASGAGLSIESTAGAVEALSKMNVKGSEAGTALRNIILKMQTTLGVDFKKTSMAEALDELKPRLEDTAYLSQVFGMENIAAAQFLIKNSALVSEFTDRVTDTSVAQELAAVNTNTWSHKLAVQKAQFNDWFISIGESNKGILNFIQVGGQMGSMIGSFAPLMEGGIAVAQGFGKAIMFVSDGGMMKLVRSLNVTIAKTWAWTAALLANPTTWVVLGIMALVAAIAICWNKFAEFRAVLLTTWDAIKGFGKALLDYMLTPLRAISAITKGISKAYYHLFRGEFSEAGKAITDGFKEGFNAAKDSLQSSLDGFRDTAGNISGNYEAHLSVERAKQNEKDGIKISGFNGSFSPLLNFSAGDGPAMAYALPAGGNTTQINYQPNVTVSSELTEESRFNLMNMLRDNAGEMVTMMDEQRRKSERGNYDN